MARMFSRRTSQALLILLSLFLFGTIAFLWAVRSYFSIDAGAIIRPEELGTWEEIRAGAPEYTLSWKARYPYLAKALSLKPQETVILDSKSQLEFDDAIAKQAAEAAKAAGFGDDGGLGYIPSGRDNTPKPWNPTTDPPEKIPRIIHQTWKDKNLPPQWQLVRDECARMHPDYEYRLWTDADSRQFIEDYYPWFLPIFDSYPYNIQRADAIRYFILHKYGGIYMDLDVGCLRRFDPLLRFEVVLPKTIPVGVSNDVMASAKEHPFMDHLIHNLVTFNHRYLTHYPTVMFSTGPMFVSASYGLYVDAEGLSTPSTPGNPSAGFSGIRVLPKPLYGKNAKPSEAPDAFFRHFYGSSWHEGDAGFLIFLRDHGRFLIFVGFIVVMYCFGRSLAPRLLMALGDRSDRRRRHTGSRRRGRWISLPFVRDPRSGEYRSISSDSYRMKHSNRNFFDESTQTNPSTLAGALPTSNADSTVGLRSIGDSRLTFVAAPRPQRAGLPLFDMSGDSENSNGEDDMDLGPGLNLERIGHHTSNAAAAMSGGIMNWMNAYGIGSSASSSRPQSSTSIAMSSDDQGSPSSANRDVDTHVRSASMSKKKDKNSGVLYLPAYLVGSGSSSIGSQDSAMGAMRALEDEGLTSPTDSHIFRGSPPPWKLTKPHTRNGSNIFNANNSNTGSFGSWASTLLNSEGSTAIQKIWGNVSFGARTPSPTMVLSNALYRSRDEPQGQSSKFGKHEKGRDIESYGNGTLDYEVGESEKMTVGKGSIPMIASSSQGSFSEMAKPNPERDVYSHGVLSDFKRREGSDGIVSIQLDDNQPPPPYDFARSTNQSIRTNDDAETDEPTPKVSATRMKGGRKS